MAKFNGKLFDLNLFSRLMDYSKPYRGIYYFVLLSAILLSIFSTLSPYLLKIVIDDYIIPKDFNGLVMFSFLMLLSLFLEVIFQFIFIYAKIAQCLISTINLMF